MSGAGFQPRSIVRRAPLLSTCAVAAALVAGGHGTPVRAQLAPTPNPSYLATGISADATITVGTGATPSTTISLNQPTAIIDWTPTDNATNTSANINFQAGGTATFFSDFSGFTVLNRVVPATGPGGFIRAIEFNGTTTTSSPNGAVWFYSPGGIIAGPTAVFDVGSLVLSANDIDTTGGLFGTGGQIRFRGIAGSRSSVTIQPGADLRATSEGSYIALVAPRIDQGGTVTVNGSAAYLAAESADITINSGLFNFAVTAGSTVDAGGETTLRHTGTTTGPAPGSTADPHAIYMVAIPKNDAVTMLISGTGTLGYASSASVENGVVILSAGANVTSTANGLGGADVAATAGPAPGVDAFIDIAGGTVTSRLTGVAVTDAIASARLTNALSFSGNLELAAGRTASLIANAGETITVGGSLGLTSLGLSPFGIPTPGEASLRSLGGGSITINGVAAINASASALVGNATGGTAALEVNESTMTIGAGAFLSADAEGGVGGNGQGGTASVSVVRTALNVGGAISISATGRGGRGQDGGSGTGGTASLTSDEGNVTIGAGLGGLQIDARGFGASGSSNSSGGDGGNGGAGTGGTASLTATNGGGFGIASISLQAGGFGGDGGGAFEFGYGASGNGGNGGNGLGGMSIVSISQASIAGGLLSVDAVATAGGGGFSSSGIGGNSGNATGGTATATIADVASASFPLGIRIDAGAYGNGEGEGGGGSNALAVGGIGGTSTGGTARLTLTNTTLTTASVDVISDAEATDGGFGITRGAASGAATGGTSELIVQNSSFGTGGVLVSATADAGEDEGSDRGGDARGGSASISLDGGVAAFAGSVTVDASAGSDEEPESTGDAFGGSAAFAARNFGSIDITGNLAILADAAAGTNATGIGGASTGGSASLTVEQTSLAIGSSGLDLSATAYGADAPNMGGAATGGSATITVTEGDLTFSTPLSIAANGAGGDGASGGAGTGGAVRLIANGGSINVPNDLFLSALGQGGRSDVGGDAGIGRGGIVSIFSGGSSLLASILRGSIALQNVTLDARGIGGAANEFGYGATGGGDGGAAFGGDILIEARNGDIQVDIESTVSLLASGTGGTSFDGGASGDATGGSASILATADVNGAGFIDLPVVQIDVSGNGGDPFETGYGIPAGESGGSGIGGEATILAGAGELAIDTLSVNADGVGARGDDGGNGAGGDGGAGAGGAILLGTTGGTLTLSGVDLSAAGRGGDGGHGDNGEDGGDGGAATGGSITIRAADQSLTLFNLSADTRANGGNGGDGGGDSEVNGGSGGNGGAATGGEFIAEVQGADGVLELGSLFVSNDSRGGNGGFGGFGALGGDGGSGGAATGGLFEISTELGRATLFSGEGLNIALVANAFGGDGGGGGDGFDVGNTGGVGGNGGAGTGGIARIDVNGGLLESDFTELTAQGEGGRGGDGGIGAGTPFIPGDPEAIPPIPDTPAGPVSFAARGPDGQGSGGTATILVNDNVDTGEAGLATLLETVIETSGFTPDDDGFRFTDTAGRIEISDLGSDEAGGLVISNLSATSGGFAPTSDQAFDIFSAGRRIAITNDAIVEVGGPAYFRASGPGGVDIGGTLDVSSNFFVSIEHDSQPTPFASTISANSINIRASSDVSASPDSLITSANDITILSEFGGIALNIANAGTNIDLEAPNDISASVLNAGTDIEIDAGYDPFALDDDNIIVGTGGVALGSVTSTGGEIDIESVGAVSGGDLSAGHELTITSETGSVSLASAEAGTLDEQPSLGNPRSIGISAAQNIAISGNASAPIDIGLHAETGSIGVGSLDAGRYAVLLAAGAVNVGPVVAPGMLYVANSSMLGTLGTGPDDYDATNLIGVTPVATGGDVNLTGPIDAGPVVIAAGGALNATSIASTDDIRLNAGGAILVSTDITANGLITAEGMAVTLNAIDLLDVDSVTATDGDVLLNAGGAIAARTTSATGNIGLGAGDTIDIATDLTAGGRIALFAGGAITTRNLTASNSIMANSMNGSTTVEDVESVGGFVRLSSDGDLSVGDVRAAGSIFLTGNAAITAGDLTAGTGPLLPGEQGGGTDPAVPGIAGGFDDLSIVRCDDCATSSVALPFEVNFFGQTYANTFISNNGYLTFNSPQGTFTPTGLGSDYFGQPIISAFFADVDTRNAGSEQATYGAGTFAGRQAFGATWDGVGYFSNQADKLNSFQIILTNRSDTGPGNFDIYYNYTNITWETGSASGGVNGFGGISAAVGYNAGTGNQMGTAFELPGSRIPGSFLNNGPLPLITGTNNGNPGQLLFSVRNGQIVSALAEPATIHVTNSSSIASNANVTLGNLSAEAVEVHGAAAVTVGNVDVGHRGSGIAPTGQPFATVLDAAGSLSAGGIVGSGLVALGAGMGDLVTGGITTPSSVAVLAGGSVVLGPVSTGTGPTDSLFISNPSILTSNPALANFSFDTLLMSAAFDPAVLASLTPVRTGGALTLADPVSTGNLAAAAGGAVDLGEIDASTRISVDSASTITAQGSLAAPIIRLASSDIIISSEALIGDGASTSTIFLENTGSLPSVVGGGDAAEAWSLSNAEFGRLSAHDIDIFMPDPGSGGLTDMFVRQLDIIGSQGSATATRRVNLAGSTLTLRTLGRLDVEGAVSLTGAGPNDRIEFLADDAVRVITPSGSISITDSQGALSGTIRFNAELIGVGSESALGDIAAPNLSTDDIDERLGTNDGAAKPEGYLQAGALEFSIENALFIQNSGGPGLGSAARAGFTAGSGGVRIDTGESSDARIIINGRQANSDGGFTGGADLIPLLTINGSQTPTGGFDLRSTANGCLIVGTSCRFDMPPAQVPPVQDVIKEIISQSSDMTGNDGTSVVQLLNLPLIQLVDLSGLGFLPLIDEPVTGAGNDDLWTTDPGE